jgi:hypothetical protein
MPVSFSPAALDAHRAATRIKMAAPGVNPHVALLEVKSHKDQLRRVQLAWFQRLEGRVPCGVVHVKEVSADDGGQQQRASAGVTAKRGVGACINRRFGKRG